MAMKGFIYGTKAVVKESGGKPFLSRAVPWTDAPSEMPEAVRARASAFTSAAKACSSESKGKGGTVWGVSDYNKCISKKLKSVTS